MTEIENNVVDPVTNVVTVLTDSSAETDAVEDCSAENIVAPRREHVHLSRETQGMFAYQNWLTTHEDESKYLSGKRKRAIRRDFIRRAKKGAYEHIFNATGQINDIVTETGNKMEKTENDG